MKIKDLIEKLERLDPEARAFCHGYEGGYAERDYDLKEEEFALNVIKSSWQGPHELLSYVLKDKGDYFPKEYKTVKAVVI